MAWYKVPAQSRLYVLIYYDYEVHIPLPTHFRVQSPGSLWAVLPGPEQSARRPTSSRGMTGPQLPKCVCSQSTVFMKLSDSTSTSDSAWVLLG